jgi:hypothetical protein
LKIIVSPRASALPDILAFLRTTCLPSLRTLEIEVLHDLRSRHFSSLDLSTDALAVSHKFVPVGSLHRVRLVFRNVDVIYDLEHLLSVFRLEGVPDMVEVCTGTATLIPGPPGRS